MEMATTLLACVIAFAFKRDGLTAALCIAWAISMVAAFFLKASFLPGVGSAIETCVAIYSLRRWTEFGSQRARCTGLVSLAALFVHFGISANMGGGNWWLYAIVINALFVLQCGIAGGGFHGLVGILNNVSPRRNFSSEFVNRERG